MPDQNSLLQELEQLLDKLDGSELTPQERHRIGEVISSDSEALEYYLDHIEMESLLREACGLMNRSLPIPGITTKPRKSFRHRLSLTVITASLLFALVGFGVGFWTRTPEIKTVESPPQQPEIRQDSVLPDQQSTSPDWDTTSESPLCQITHRTQAELHQRCGNSFCITTDHELPAGQYYFDQGNLELLYNNGAKVILQSPAHFRLITSKHLFLEEGRINVVCPTSESKGFVVETPSGLATDLGTEFAVEVNSKNGKKDEFHVFTGKVALKTKLNSFHLKLSEGEATRLDHETSTPAGINLDRQRFIRSLDSDSHDYYQRVMSYQPNVYYNMKDEGNGLTLFNEMKDQYHANIVKPQKSGNHWAPGFNGGTSFLMDGMKHRIYAYVPDYPKAESDHLTVMAWVYAESRPAWASIAKNWGHKDKAIGRGQFHFGLYQYTGHLEVSINDKNDQEIFAIDSEPLPLYEWHHVALVVDESSLKLYRNGRIVAQSDCNGLNGNPSIKPLAIGTKLGNNNFKPAVRNNSFWDGRIDHLAIIHQSLDPNDVKELHDIGRDSIGKN